MKNIEELIKTGKATIVDVRTPAEYGTGHVEGSKLLLLNNKIKRR